MIPPQNWSEPRQIPTRSGLRSVRLAYPCAELLFTWRTEPDRLKDHGITCSQEPGGAWIAYHWLPVGRSEAGQGQDMVGEVKARPGANVSEKIAAKLRDYQVPLVSNTIQGVKDHGAHLNKSGMGTGKSFMAAGALSDLELFPVVMARKSALNIPWKTVLSDFGMGEHLVTNPEAVRYGRTELGKWSGSIFKWTLPENSVLIWDEVHNCGGFDYKQNRPSKLGTMLMSARDQGVKVMALSATAANSPLKMHSLGYVLGLHNGSDFISWCYEHGCEVGPYGLEFNCGVRHVLAIDLLNRARAQQEVMNRISQKIFGSGKGCGIRAEDIPGFPENNIIPVAIDFSETAKINKVYAEMLKELEALGEKRSNQFEVRGVMMRAQQQAELLMVPEIVEEVREAVEQGLSVPIFVIHRETVRVLAEKLKTDCIVIGEQHPSERDKWIKAFQADRERIIINTMAAGSESVSYHDLNGLYPRQSVLIPGFWAEMVMQALGRTPRNGALTKVVQKILFGRGTIQEKAYHNMLAKQKRIQAFNGELVIDDSDLLFT